MINFRELIRRFRNSPRLIVVTVVSLALASWGAGSLMASMSYHRDKTAIVMPSATGSNEPTESPSVTPTPTSTPAPVPATAKPAAKTTTAAVPRSQNCANPLFTTSSHDGGWSNGGYYVHNNMWNDNESLGPETLSACSYHSWYVVSSQTNHAGAVKTYPNVHKDYNDMAISSFKTITSTFAATSPHVGIYNVAYDIWLNGVADNNSTELMIWTENYRQTPAGDKVATVAFGGRTYDVWKESDNKYIAFVPTTAMTSGNLNLLEMFKWLQSKGWLNSGATVGQIDYGVEIVSTDGKPATFSFTDFSITSN